MLKEILKQMKKLTTTIAKFQKQSAKKPARKAKAKAGRPAKVK